MSDPYFSVIIPFYNKERSIGACVRSLLEQELPGEDFEIIAVDNNSTDGSLEIVKGFPKVKIVKEPVQNPYTARNTAAKIALGKVLVFTDADVVAPQNWLLNIKKQMEQNSADILIGWYDPGRPQKLLQLHSLLVAERIKRALEKNQPQMLTACAANLAVKKDVFEKEGCFRNDSNSEDMYFSIRCLEKGARAGFGLNSSVTRMDIDSIRICLLKNFIYGCSNARDQKRDGSIAEKIKYMLITVKFVVKYFPLGAGLLLFTCSYFSGYFLSKVKVLDRGRVEWLIRRYTEFTAKRGV